MEYNDKMLAVIVAIIYLIIIIINILTAGWEPYRASQNITNLTYIPMIYIPLIQ
jgi:hypothetical protein